MSRIIQLTFVISSFTWLFKIVADAVGFHVAERPAYILLDDVNNAYDVIFQTFVLEYFSELQITTMVWNTKEDCQNNKVIFKTIARSRAIEAGLLAWLCLMDCSKKFAKMEWLSFGNQRTTCDPAVKNTPYHFAY